MAPSQPDRNVAACTASIYVRILSPVFHGIAIGTHDRLLASPCIQSARPNQLASRCAIERAEEPDNALGHEGTSSTPRVRIFILLISVRFEHGQGRRRKTDRKRSVLRSSSISGDDLNEKVIELSAATHGLTAYGSRGLGSRSGDETGQKLGLQATARRGWTLAESARGRTRTGPGGGHCCAGGCCVRFCLSWRTECEVSVAERSSQQ